MAIAVESLPNLMQQRWNLRNVGGDALRAVVGSERREKLRNARNIILELGNDGRIHAESANPWEQIAHEFIVLTRTEADVNSDLKAATGEMPSRDEVADFVTQLDVGGRVEVVQGCPSRPEDTRLGQMITVSVYDEDGVISQIHMSPILDGDRRYNTRIGATNRMQQFALDPDRQLRDVVTNLEVDTRTLREELPSLNAENMAMGDLLIYLSRYVLNIVRGLHYINKWGIEDEWMPNIPVHEQRTFLAVASSLPDFVKRGVIENCILEEFRQRMMASYLINPKLFINLVVVFDMNAAFPFFDEIVRQNKISEDLRMPETSGELIQLVIATMGSRFNEGMSVLGNVAKMFGVGRFRWEDEDLLY